MGVNARRNVVYLCGLILLLVNVCKAVKINSITVPPRYELKDDADVLILDCDFSVNPSDTGFVLKWLHNNVAIYQWIPSKRVPFALGAFKGRVDTNYTTSDDRYKKHSALLISKPLVSDSGNYTCNVQTFQGSDKQSAEMQIIDPEDSIDLIYKIDDQEESVDVICAVHNIYPLPEIKLLFDNEERDVQTEVEKNLEEEVWDVTVTAKLKKSEIKDESPVSCVVKIPNSDYVKEQTITYDESSGPALKTSVGLILLSVMLLTMH